MKNALILHGTGADSNSNWFQWMKQKLQEKEYKVWVPDLPKATDPSATEDPRFFANRLRREEVPDCHIEISVLSPLERIEDPLDLQLGTHGIYVKGAGRTGCFLPQVATETGWSKEEFLGNCCAGKAGLSPDAWRDPATEVYVFTAEIVQE